MSAVFNITEDHFNKNKTNIWLISFLLVNRYSIGDKAPVHEYIIWIHSMHRQFKEQLYHQNISINKINDYHSSFTKWLEVYAELSNEALA